MPVIIDTLSFRLRDSTPEKVISFLGLEYIDFPFVHGGCFNVNYKESLYCEGIRIGYNSTSDWDVYVHLSGKGCRYIEDVFKISAVHSWWVIINRLAELCRQGNAAITRLDLACDEYDNFLRLDRIEKYIIQHKYLTRCSDKSIRLTKFGEECLYVGSTQSQTLLRIYNKKLERGYDKDDKDIEFWHRAELQFRDDHAQQVVQEIADSRNIGKVFTGHLRYHFNFLKEPNMRDGTQSRIELAPWWRDFLADEEPIDWIPTPGTEYNLSKLERYARQGCGSTIKTLILSHNLTPNELYRVYTSNSISLRTDQLALIDLYSNTDPYFDRT